MAEFNFASLNSCRWSAASSVYKDADASRLQRASRICFRAASVPFSILEMHAILIQR